MVPYPGLRSFKPELNQFFFGRERQKAELKAFFAGRAREAGETRRQITFVVGGSGSGKSSLTLAGLIAELNTIDMVTTAGAWYVAQMRPAQDPIAQLLAALSDVVARVVDIAVADANPKGTAEQFTKVAAALKCADARDLPSLKARLHDKLSERLAPIDKATGRRSLAITALFQFVDETLDKLDELESHAQRSGKPLLLIHIDQFEEVFREQTDADGRQALMQLLRKVHEYAPERLFVVATMRSEELHKCSEFEGIAEVINSSMYLIDLVSSEEIERAIVEPARRQTTLWELPSNVSETAPYTAEAVRWLQRAYQSAGVAALHTADQLPLLQHFLPLLWEQAVDDWLLRKGKDPAARLEITRDHIERVPGWIAPEKSGKESSPETPAADSQNQQSHLGRCLNAHASTVLTQAINKWGGADASPVPDRSPGEKAADNPKAGFGNPGPERAILIAAFCCLAQLDDRGRPARRFATLEDIVAASGLTEWKSLKYDHAALGKGLVRELSEFEAAGLIERIGQEELLRYNVNHEAFIRNWNSYESWLKEKQFVQQRLREIGLSVGRFNHERGWNPLDSIFANQARDAYAVIPDETGSRLGSVFGDRPIFSRAWAAAALSADEGGKGATGAESAPAQKIFAEKLDAIERIWQDAGWWQQKGVRRQAIVGRFGALLVGLFIALFVATLFAWSQWSKNDTLGRQLRNALISQSAIATLSTREGNAAAQYRELYASMKIAYGDVTLSLTGEPLTTLHGTLFQIDSGVRRLLGGDVSLQLESDLRDFHHAELVHKGRKKASCKIVGAGDYEKGVTGTAQDGVGVSFLPRDGYWIPVAGDSKSQQEQRDEEETGRGIPLSENALVCLSGDARWLMYWTRAELSPILHRVFLVKRGAKWRAEFVAPRQIGSSIDSAKLNEIAPAFYNSLIKMAGSSQSLKQIEWFNNDGGAGFVLPAAQSGGSKLLVWTTTGLLDADGPQNEALKGLVSCEYKPTKARGSVSSDVQQCAIDVEELGSEKRALTITYSKDSCREECPSVIELRFQDDAPTKGNDVQKRDDVDKRIVHLNVAEIKKAKMESGWLWVEDASGKVWRYIVDKNRIEPLLEMKWQGVSWRQSNGQGTEGFVPSTSCLQFEECKKYLSSPEGNWPAPPPELMGEQP